MKVIPNVHISYPVFLQMNQINSSDWWDSCSGGVSAHMQVCPRKVYVWETLDILNMNPLTRHDNKMLPHLKLYLCRPGWWVCIVALNNPDRRIGPVQYKTCICISWEWKWTHSLGSPAEPSSSSPTDSLWFSASWQECSSPGQKDKETRSHQVHHVHILPPTCMETEPDYNI